MLPNTTANNTTKEQIDHFLPLLVMAFRLEMNSCFVMR
jgi:hypothetical protein